MPLPSRRDYIRQRQSTASAGAWVVNIPVPTGAVYGDWLVAVLSIGTNSTGIDSSVGWHTKVHFEVNSRTMSVQAHQYQAGDGATIPITFNVAAATAAEVACFAIADAASIENWTIGTIGRRVGAQTTNRSPSITAPENSLVFALEIEATNAIEVDGGESISGATKWFGSPNQTTASVDIDRVLVSYIEMAGGGVTNDVVTTWPISGDNGMGVQIAIPHFTMTNPGPSIIAEDEFGRTIPAAWGTADIGGQWTGGTNLSVDNGKGRITLTSSGSSSGSILGSTWTNDVEFYTEWSIDKLPIGSNARPRFKTRRVTGTIDYHIRASISPAGVTDYRWYKADIGALASTITLPETYVPGDVLKVRARTFPDSGGTRLQAKMWFAYNPEPSTWGVNIIDSAVGYQTGGTVAINAGLGVGVTNGPIVFSFDNLLAQHTTPEATPATGNIGVHLISFLTQTSFRVGIDLLNVAAATQAVLYQNNVEQSRHAITVDSTSGWGNTEFTGLTAATNYVVKFEVGGTIQTDAQLTLQTLSNINPALFKIVAGSCQFTGSNHPIFDRMREDNPLFIAHMGDLHYGDKTITASWRADVESSLTAPRMKQLLESVPFSWTWDNHDRIIIDTLNTGSTDPATASEWKKMAGSTGWLSSDTAGRTWVIGRIRFIQTDQWTVRNDPDLVAEPRTFLGAAQKAAFKAVLEAAEEPIIVWFCQWTGQNNANGRWNSFNAETTELENWLNAHPSIKERIILIGGDSHSLQADTGTRVASHRFSGVPSLNISGFNRSSTGLSPGGWDIANNVLRTDAEIESNWGGYSRMTFTDDGSTVGVLWEAVRVNVAGTPDIMATYERRVGVVEIDGTPAITEYYHSGQSRMLPLGIETVD